MADEREKLNNTFQDPTRLNDTSATQGDDLFDTRLMEAISDNEVRQNDAPKNNPVRKGRRKSTHDPVPISVKQENTTPPTPPSKVRKREQRSGCLGGLMYFLFILCLSIALAFFAWMAASDVMALNKRSFTATVDLPTSAFTSETVIVKKDDGTEEEKIITHADLKYVSNTLKQAGLVHYSWLFEFFCKISNADVKFDPGEYELKSSYDYRALVQNMREGAGAMVTVDVTIPEGFTMQDIFRRLEENKVATYDAFLKAAAEYNFKYDFVEASSYAGAARLEGYLFPDTYQFYVSMEASSAINKLLNNFYLKYNNDMISQTEKMGLTVKDIVTVASIIEKEAKLEEDRAYVASVIYNRLVNGISLGMDSTILYLYQDHKGEPTAEMLADNSPYNTHLNVGLPPTPICNPGLASITAALNPAESNYYYFYADPDSDKLNFFTSYEEFSNYAATHPHNAA